MYLKSDNVFQLPCCLAFNYPIFGVQFHPEKNCFEWIPKNVNHSRDAVEICHFFADFLVSEGEECIFYWHFFTVFLFLISLYIVCTCRNKCNYIQMRYFTKTLLTHNWSHCIIKIKKFTIKEGLQVNLFTKSVGDFCPTRGWLPKVDIRGPFILP